MTSRRGRGRRDNGLDAALWSPLRDVDPRVGEHLLDVLHFLVPGTHELIFDGNSFVMDARGDVTQRAPAFEACTFLVEFNRNPHGVAVPISSP